MNNNSKRFLTNILTGIFVLTLFSFNPNDSESLEISRNLEIFNTLFKEVNKLYVEDIDPEQLIKVGIKSMLESLDPYTSFIPPEKLGNFRSMITGEYNGIGAEIDQKWNQLVVTMIYDGYPAHKAGLEIGDEIVKVDDASVYGKTKSEIDRMLKGEENTSVELEIRRFDHKKLIKKTLKREKLYINNVKYAGLVRDNVGYIKLTEFTSGAGNEVRYALEELKSAGATGIIFDLRDNPGGLLVEAINVANVFVSKGRLVVKTKGKVNNYNKIYRTLDDPVDTEIPLVVLVNHESASAAEIVAGVIQDYDRGIIVGDKTYGKGLVQATRPISHDSHLKITTAKYYMPSGRCIQVAQSGSNSPVFKNHSSEDDNSYLTSNGREVNGGHGVEPDIEVEIEKENSIVRLLNNKGFIFDFATEYFYQNESICDPENFTISEKDYQEFLKYLKDRDFNFQTDEEEQLMQFKNLARNDSYYNEIEQEISSILNKITRNKHQELLLNRKDIVEALENEIISRYYLEEGLIRNKLQHEQEIGKAIEMLVNMHQYNVVLASIKEI